MDDHGVENKALYVAIAGVWRGIIALVGLLGNLLVIIVYARKKCRTSGHVFIVSLAASDFISSMDFPFAIYHSMYALNYTNGTVCKLNIFIRTTISYFSLLLIGIIAVDRHQVCCRSHRRFKPRGAIVVVGFCFVGAILFGSPALVFNGAVKHEDTVRNSSEISVCGRRREYLQIHFIYSVVLALTYLIAVLMMIVLYTRIAISIRRARRIIHAISNQVPFDDAAGMRQVESGRHTPAHDAPPADVQAIHPNPPGVVSSSQENHSNPQREAPQLLQRLRLFETATTSTSGVEERNRYEPGLIQHPYGDRARRIDSASKMLFISTIIIAVTWLPSQVMQFFVQLLTMPLKDTNPLAFSLLILAYLLILLNHAIDPILYSFVNKKFRLDCAKLLCRLRDLQ